MAINTLEELEGLFRAKGVRRIYVKHLSKHQDNDKNQIYFGKDLASASNLFPSCAQVTRIASTSRHKRLSSPGKPKLESELNLFWLSQSGQATHAPHAKIIDYFQYPETRLSGFLKNCSHAPNSLRKRFQETFGRRILVLGSNQDGQTFGFVLSECEDPLTTTFPKLPVLPALPIFQTKVIGEPWYKSPRELLLDELRHQVIGRWHDSRILRPGQAHPEPFIGNQGGGYTLEALLGVSANARKEPDKHGYEIKSYSGSRITLMTPSADAGYEGRHTFREFMHEFGRSGIKGDGRRVFTGVYRCNKVNQRTGLILKVTGYDSETDTFSERTSEIRVSIIEVKTNRVVSSWTIDRLFSAWTKKHASACYIKCTKRRGPTDPERIQYRYLEPFYVCEGTSIWQLLRSISSGVVYYDPAHTIYADGTAKVRPQWRIDSLKLFLTLQHLYKNIETVSC